MVSSFFSNQYRTIYFMKNRQVYTSHSKESNNQKTTTTKNPHPQKEGISKQPKASKHWITVKTYECTWLRLVRIIQTASKFVLSKNKQTNKIFIFLCLLPPSPPFFVVIVSSVCCNVGGHLSTSNIKTAPFKLH